MDRDADHRRVERAMCWLRLFIPQLTGVDVGYARRWAWWHVQGEDGPAPGTHLRDERAAVVRRLTGTALNHLVVIDDAIDRGGDVYVRYPGPAKEQPLAPVIDLAEARAQRE